MSLPITYVLPIKWSPDLDRDEIGSYLERLSTWVDEVLMVDGSSPEDFAANTSAWGSRVKHLAPDAGLSFGNGKVDGVVTGVRAAGNEKVVIADDDVRYDEDELRRVTGLLDDYDLVRPQNVYLPPMPWHALLDTSRMLLNRAWSRDYPGTLGFKRSMFLAIGGYDGDTMFENLELIRTVKAWGGAEAAPLDLYVTRQPPSADRFISQRVRQAYDEFALPERMALWFAVLPLVGWLVRRRNLRLGLTLVGATIATAEIGRRRGKGTEVFPARASFFAPLWVLERGTSMWLAVEARLTGGVRYGGGRIPKAANSRRWHRAQVRARRR